MQRRLYISKGGVLFTLNTREKVLPRSSFCPPSGLCRLDEASAGLYCRLLITNAQQPSSE